MAAAALDWLITAVQSDQSLSAYAFELAVRPLAVLLIQQLALLRVVSPKRSSLRHAAIDVAGRYMQALASLWLSILIIALFTLLLVVPGVMRAL